MLGNDTARRASVQSAIRALEGKTWEQQGETLWDFHWGDSVFGPYGQFQDLADAVRAGDVKIPGRSTEESLEMIDRHFERLAVAIEISYREERRKRRRFIFLLFMVAMLLIFFAIGPQNIATSISDFIVDSVGVTSSDFSGESQ